MGKTVAVVLGVILLLVHVLRSVGRRYGGTINTSCHFFDIKIEVAGLHFHTDPVNAALAVET